MPIWYVVWPYKFSMKEERRMRGIDTQVRKIRRRVFKEVANLAYTSEDLINDVEALPYKIVDYDESQYGNIYRERAIVRERIRLAMGLTWWEIAS